MTKAITTLLIISGILFLIYMNRPSGADQRLLRLDKQYSKRLDSLKSVYEDSLHRRELFYLKSFSDAVRAKDRAEGEANHWKQKYTNEKNSNRSFTDNQLDSLISAIR